MFRSIFIGTVRQWHWISSAVCLLGLLFFAVTGITLNNASIISADSQVTTIETELTPGLLILMNNNSQGTLPLAVRKWLKAEHNINSPNSQAEWDDFEVYLAMPQPGGDAWLSIDLESGLVIYEQTQRGWVAYFNDLHKGRNTGNAWSWFIDVFAILCLIFALSGLWLLARYAKQRPSTWPLVVAGLLLPLIILLLTVH